MQVLKIVGITAGSLLAVFSIYKILGNTDTSQATEALVENATAVDSSGSLSSQGASLDNIPELQLDSPTVKDDSAVATALDVSPSDENASLEIDSPSVNTLDSFQDFPPLDLFLIGSEDISDADLEALIDRLNNDPDSLTGLINELRMEGDPERVKRLLFVVGATKNKAVLPAAEELLYSGDNGLRDKGLELLGRIAPVDPQAMFVASNLLVSETEPRVLMAAINVIAQPGAASTEDRESVVPQITALMAHESASVRGFSLTTASRLSNNADLAPILYDGLYDTHSSVRNSAISALSNFPYRSLQANQKLLDMARDESEVLDIRQSAIKALLKSPPDDLSQEELDAISLQIRKEKRQQRINGN